MNLGGIVAKLLVGYPIFLYVLLQLSQMFGAGQLPALPLLIWLAMVWTISNKFVLKNKRFFDTHEKWAIIVCVVSATVFWRVGGEALQSGQNLPLTDVASVALAEGLIFGAFVLIALRFFKKSFIQKNLIDTQP